jgi:RND family efflux transporter MFP subunit
MKRIALFLFAAILAAASFGGGYWYAQRKAAARPAAPPERKVLYWVDPMHPAYKSDRPGVAPDCGMKLQPVYADSQVPRPEEAAALPPGTLQISAEKQQLAGIAFATAEISSAGETLRAVGKVAVDETRISRVHPRIEGWVSRTHADFTGQLVRTGDPLVTLYSPELLAAQQELVLALKARDALRSSSHAEAVESSEALVAASRRRLELLALDQARIQELERTRSAVRDVTVLSPATGYVTARGVFPGQKVSPETELYAIADLSRVWIMADVFETDLAKIRSGQSAWVTPASAPGRGFQARVDYIQPQVDPTSRTLKVRLEAENPDLRLKPDLFVNVEFRMSLAARVTVPANAVVNTGTRRLVYVDLGGGRLEPRRVETGDRAGDRIQILSGLRAGERVVAAGTFLVDSEAQLQNAAAPADHGGHRQ